MGLLHALAGCRELPFLILGHRLGQQIVDGLETLLPVVGDFPVAVRAVLLFRHQLVAAVQHRLNLVQLVLQPVNFALHLGHGFAFADHFANFAEGALHLVAFLGRNINADRAFEIFEHFEVSHLHFAAGFIDLLLLVQRGGFIEASFNVVDIRGIIGGCPRQ